MNLAAPLPGPSLDIRRTARLRPEVLWGWAVSLLVHLLLVGLALEWPGHGAPADRAAIRTADTLSAPARPMVLRLIAPSDVQPAPAHPDRSVMVASGRAPRAAARPARPAPPAAQAPAAAPASAPRTPASQSAPDAPTAAEWAFASRYTLKNSKAWRYTWGQQVRSMMGTAVEGPDQGVVRFRVEIAPDGTLVRLDTLWSTSALAERLAREAVGRMGRWPPPPTGQSLVFDRTITFTPDGDDGPPIYRNDCRPTPPAFKNPFAWDGGAVSRPVAPPHAQPLDPQALAECLAQLPEPTVDGEIAHDQRLLDQWGSDKIRK